MGQLTTSNISDGLQAGFVVQIDLPEGIYRCRSYPHKRFDGFSFTSGKPKIGLGFSITVMAAAQPSVSRASRGVVAQPALLVVLFLLLPCFIPAANESYTLKKGETLYRISRKFDVPVHILQRYNQITDPSSLREGTLIQIPSRYTVEKGDTLYGISRRFEVDLNTLMEFNNISDSTALKIGAVLYIPGSAAGPGVAANNAKQEGGAHGAAGSSDSATSAAKSETAKSALLWPHPGTRETLSGRITGTLIYGNLGDVVVSVSSGRVIWSGPYRGFSRVILIEGKNGYTYVYAGNEETLVAVGDTVVPGAEIGRLGKNVHQGVPQLYFLVYRNGKPVDPSLAPRS
jgi:lipoprotein YgeR